MTSESTLSVALTGSKIDYAKFSKATLKDVGTTELKDVTDHFEALNDPEVIALKSKMLNVLTSTSYTSTFKKHSESLSKDVSLTTISTENYIYTHSEEDALVTREYGNYIHINDVNTIGKTAGDYAFTLDADGVTLGDASSGGEMSSVHYLIKDFSLFNTLSNYNVDKTQKTFTYDVSGGTLDSYSEAGSLIMGSTITNINKVYLLPTFNGDEITSIHVEITATSYADDGKSSNVTYTCVLSDFSTSSVSALDTYLGSIY